jgi:hypothetical protein
MGMKTFTDQRVQKLHRFEYFTKIQDGRQAAILDFWKNKKKLNLALAGLKTPTKFQFDLSKGSKFTSI